MIVSSVPGRIRVRSRRLKSENRAKAIQAEVETFKGVASVYSNPHAGSLTVAFDPENVEAEKLEDRLEALCDPQPNKLERNLEMATRIGMAGTIAATIYQGFYGSKRTHIQLGKAFMGVAAAHLGLTVMKALR